jgi:phage terminase small subunit
MKPKIRLSSNAPARLRGHKRAAAVWRRLMKVYNTMTAQIVTGLDWILVENFCLGVEELDELATMRKSAYQAYIEINESFETAQKTGDAITALELTEALASAYDAVLKVDARVDRKKQLLHTLGQSLYVTPRARAGVAPSEKEKSEDAYESNKLIDGGMSWNEVLKMNAKEAGNG